VILPTVRVRRKADGSECRINERDFDLGLHDMLEQPEPEPLPQPEPEPQPEAAVVEEESAPPPTRKHPKPRKPKGLTIIDALEDPQLFGGLPAFKDLSTWTAWLVFLKALYGLPLSKDEVAIFCERTGRAIYDPPQGGWREVAAIVGRQSGKTRISATIADFEAMTAPEEPDGSEIYAILVAQDQRASLRGLFRYACVPFERIPLLENSVESKKAATLTLETRCVLAAYPCRPQAVRGLRARVVVCDELAFYRSSEGHARDLEMLRAVRPMLATTGGKLITLSSPYGQTGALWNLHRKHFGVDGSDVLIWQATAPQMNPTLPLDYLARMEREDPEAFASEVLGQFRAGLSLLLDPDAVADCVDGGVRERPYDPATSYKCFCDPSGGRRDKFTVAIAHWDATSKQSVLDCVRAWAPPFDPAAVIAEAALLVKSYGVSEIHGDKYAAEFVVSAWRQQGCRYTASKRDRSTIYLDLLPLINAQAVRLLEHDLLRRELVSLERRRGAAGKDRIDHPSSGHDDVANSVAGVLTLCGSRPRHASMFNALTGERIEAWNC